MRRVLGRLCFGLATLAVLTLYGLPIVVAVGLHPALAPVVGWEQTQLPPAQTRRGAIPAASQRSPANNLTITPLAVRHLSSPSTTSPTTPAQPGTGHHRPAQPAPAAVTVPTPPKTRSC